MCYVFFLRLVLVTLHSDWNQGGFCYFPSGDKKCEEGPVYSTKILLKIWSLINVTTAQSNKAQICETKEDVI